MCAPNVLEALLKEIAAGLRDIFRDKLDSVILCGSYARGDYDDESDVDVTAKLHLTADEIRVYRPRASALASAIGLKYDIKLT